MGLGSIDNPPIDDYCIYRPIGLKLDTLSGENRQLIWPRPAYRTAVGRPPTHNVKGSKMIKQLVLLVWVMTLTVACTQETQNKIGRSIQNWTGTNGVLDVYAGDKLVNRFIKIDKLSTATGTDDSKPRPYRFGYGVMDSNFNFVKDGSEKKVYFEFSDYSTSYVFYESPN